MISSLRLKNFKCFTDQTIGLAPITLLAGLNGMGKSTVIQSMLVLRQSFLDGHLHAGQLSTAGEIVDLGRARDILSDAATDDIIEVSMQFGRDKTHPASFAFVFRGESDDAVAHHDIISAIETVEGACALFSRPIPNQAGPVWFHYLQAERNGPRKFLPMGHGRAGALEIGVKGEFVLHMLDVMQDAIKLDSEDPRAWAGIGGRLRDQVECWLGEISPGVQLSISAVSAADLLVAGFSFGSPGQLRSRDYRPTNVGFGLSYTLPVLVALLGTPRGGMILIENPEAHLHPRGQTKLGELCAFAAKAGVQLIIETHSDHVMDGVRIAVRQGRIPADDVAFHYFRRKGGQAEVVSPVVHPDGRLSEWPEGFFDQHRRNTAQLLRPTKHGI